MYHFVTPSSIGPRPCGRPYLVPLVLSLFDILNVAVEPAAWISNLVTNSTHLDCIDLKNLALATHETMVQ